jgi:hypothetical protein
MTPGVSINQTPFKYCRQSRFGPNYFCIFKILVSKTLFIWVYLYKKRGKKISFISSGMAPFHYPPSWIFLSLPYPVTHTLCEFLSHASASPRIPFPTRLWCLVSSTPSSSLLLAANQGRSQHLRLRGTN